MNPKENEMNLIDQTQIDCDKRNAETSQKEVNAFLANPPKKYMAYVYMNRREIGTWTGQTLGYITHIGSEYRTNMGDTRQHVWFNGINGRKYSGVYYKSGSDIIRFREVSK